MTDLFNDQFAFWVFLIPGFILVWSFRYFTDSEKKGDFEFFGLGIICGFFNLLLYDRLVNWGAFKEIPDGVPLYVAGFILVLLSFVVGLFCAQISKQKWFRKVINFLKSNWFEGSGRRIFSGNTTIVGDERQWVVGDLPSLIKKYPELKSKTTRVKWSTHKLSDPKKDPFPGKKFSTITILIKGKFKQIFPDQNEEYLQENFGDFVYYGPGVRHRWEVLEDDSKMVTIEFKK